MISSLYGFYLMDTEPVCDNYPCLLYKISVPKGLCRMKVPLQDSVWHLCSLGYDSLRGAEVDEADEQ